MKSTDYNELILGLISSFDPPAVAVHEDPAGLEGVYAQLPGRFPKLYEQFLLSYHWEDVDLISMRLLANPGISRLLSSLLYDPYMSKMLLAKGYIPFARAADGGYDPICFDISVRKGNRDCQIVWVDHEEVLCNSKIVIREIIAPSFEDLVIHFVVGV